MKKLDVNTGIALFFTILSLGLLASVSSQIAKPRLVMGRSLTALDASLFPYIAIGALLLLSLLFLYRCLKDEQKTQSFNFTPSGFSRTLICLSFFLAYALLMNLIGFITASTLTLFALTTYFGNRQWTLGIGISVLFPVIIYFLFLHAFQVYLPESLVW
jgi:putative tricarboxylic transport membrane protein